MARLIERMQQRSCRPMCRTSMTPRLGFSAAPLVGALGFVALALASGTAAAQGTGSHTAPPAPPAPPAAPRGPVPQTLPGASGWVGISTTQVGGGSDADHVQVSYPVIVSVDPDSPAQAAGLVAGDTVLAYNDVDPRTDLLGVQRFLHPGQRIDVRVRRNGVRDVTVTVARRPSRSHMRMSVSTAVAAVPPPPMVQLGPIPIAAPLRVLRDAPLAGAQLAELNAGLASVLNVRDQGVLVVDVLPGSPAMSSGLVPGDVIVRADSFTVTSPLALIRAMRLAADHKVILDLVRKGKTQRMPLRW